MREKKGEGYKDKEDEVYSVVFQVFIYCFCNKIILFLLLLVKYVCDQLCVVKEEK